MNRPLFLYGTLLRPAVLRRFGGDPRRLRPARALGWRRVVLRGTPYPTLLQAPGEVAGALLARLAAYEGPPYALVPLRVFVMRGHPGHEPAGHGHPGHGQVGCGPCWARAWVAPRWRAATAAWP